MKMIKILIIVFIIIVVGYALYMFIGMSSTHPPLKEYSFSIEGIDFEQKLTDYIGKSEAWSIEKTDSLKNSQKQNCFWLSLHYMQNEENLEYRIKYCDASAQLEEKEQCLKVYVIGAFDYEKKSGGYKRSDEGVDKLIEFLDNKVLNNIAPKCEY